VHSLYALHATTVKRLLQQGIFLAFGADGQDATVVDMVVVSEERIVAPKHDVVIQRHEIITKIIPAKIKMNHC